MQSDSHDGNIALPRIIRVGQGSQRLSMFVAWDLCLWLGTSCFSFVPYKLISLPLQRFVRPWKWNFLSCSR